MSSILYRMRRHHQNIGSRPAMHDFQDATTKLWNRPERLRERRVFIWATRSGAAAAASIHAKTIFRCGIPA